MDSTTCEAIRRILSKSMATGLRFCPVSQIRAWTVYIADNYMRPPRILSSYGCAIPCINNAIHCELNKGFLLARGVATVQLTSSKAANR